jgi:hypothetical protein
MEFLNTYFRKSQVLEKYYNYRLRLTLDLDYTHAKFLNKLKCGITSPNGVVFGYITPVV